MKLLLAEDERSLSDALVTILKHNNYSVDAVYDGVSALDYLGVEKYDGVILDVMMPKLDGFSVLKELRSRGDKTPVLILTAKSLVDDKVQGLDLGADDYLTKPFSSKELLARIRSITRRGAIGEAANSLAFSDLILDTKSFVLSCGEEKVQLTSKEYMLMEIFMSAKGKKLSPEILMEKVWGYDSEAEINVVWTYISYLRKKLKMIGSAVAIKGIRNLGYYLEEENV